MQTPQSYPVVLKITKVIDSCKTLEQLRVAFNMTKRMTVYDQWHTCYVQLVFKALFIPCGEDLHPELLQEQYYRRMK